MTEFVSELKVIQHSDSDIFRVLVQVLNTSLPIIRKQTDTAMTLKWISVLLENFI
jgi:hypothetical protein